MLQHSSREPFGPNSDAVRGARLLLESKHRKNRNQALVEGPFAVQQALAAGLVDSVYSTDPEFPAPAGVRVYFVDSRSITALSDTVTAQGPIAVINLPSYELADCLQPNRFIVIADAISDPGNLGSLIRSAAAFGADALITTDGSADLWSGKTLRSTAGCFAELKLVQASRELLLSKVADLPLLVTAADGSADLAEVQLQSPHAWVIGSEAHGVHADFRQRASKIVRIPISGIVESLNAAVAGSICMYASARALPKLGE